MPRITFDQLPDHGRLWVFPAGAPLTPEQLSTLGAAVDDFLDQWAAHGVPLSSAREVVHDRFLMVGVDEDAEKPSGCSIDALVRRLRELGSTFGVSVIDQAPVWYRDGEGIHAVSRPAFRALGREGKVGPDTIVFDTSLTALRQLREGEFERPAAESWHGRAFFADQPTG